MFDQHLALEWVSAVGGLAGFVALAYESRRSWRRRYVPDPSIRPLLEALIEDFNSISASGGHPSAWFLDLPRQQRELALASVNGSVVDDDLNVAISEARAAYLDCWSCSSPSRPANQVASQVRAAASGASAAGRAIDRINGLSRRFGHL